jgi:hypothetical protein
MKIILDIKDNKVDFIMELLGNLSFVKTETISQSKAQFLNELNKSVEEVKLAKQGKIKLKSADQLLNEL